MSECEKDFSDVKYKCVCVLCVSMKRRGAFNLDIVIAAGFGLYWKVPSSSRARLKEYPRGGCSIRHNIYITNPGLILLSVSVLSSSTQQRASLIPWFIVTMNPEAELYTSRVPLYDIFLLFVCRVPEIMGHDTQNKDEALFLFHHKMNIF